MIQSNRDSMVKEVGRKNADLQKWVNGTLKRLNMSSFAMELNEVNCKDKRGKRRLLERDDGKKVCYLVKKFPSSRKTYDRSKSFCDGKGGILVEIKGPKDQKNVV